MDKPRTVAYASGMVSNYFLVRPVTHLLTRARHVSRLSQDELAKRLRVSKRTIARREHGKAPVGRQDVGTLAALVFPRDPAMAEELAAAGGHTLESLGLVTAPVVATPPPPPPSRLVVDAVVCVAADALGATPGTVRGALHAAFRRARELGLSLQDVEDALAKAGDGKPTRAEKRKSAGGP